MTYPDIPRHGHGGHGHGEHGHDGRRQQQQQRQRHFMNLNLPEIFGQFHIFEIISQTCLDSLVLFMKVNIANISGMAALAWNLLRR